MVQKNGALECYQNQTKQHLLQVLKQTCRSVKVCALHFVLVTLQLKLNRYLPAERFRGEVIK